jgi:luciferase family oxidoreductase group 1
MKLSVLDQAPIATGMHPAQALQNSIDLARLTDRLGYHRYWVAEHHGMPSVASPAPEILLARIGGETQGIRIGSGGVMLPHYAPLKVVEQFTVLHALYADRVDLGVGRAPGGTQLESMALMRNRHDGHQADDFVNQLLEVRAFFNKDFPRDHPFSRIRVSPAVEGSPDLWLLGSSMWSSSAAAQLGLPFAFAHFFSGQITREAFEQYRANYKPSPENPEPRAIIGIGVICADTDEEAERLTSSNTVLFKRASRGVFSTIASPEEAMAELAQSGKPSAGGGKTEWPLVVRGTPDRVREKLEEIADALQPDEVMANCIIFDHQARRRSYEMLAEAFELTPRY